MRVLFLKTNQIQEVKDSYAVNYLLPKGLAVLATEKVQKDLEKRQELRLSQTQEKKKKQQTIAQGLDGKKFTIKVKATGEGHLYASIGNNQIKKLLKTKEPVEILTKETIKSVGEYSMDIKIGGNRSSVKIVVEASE
jgi:large subunit ribosomal protein L9